MTMLKLIFRILHYIIYATLFIAKFASVSCSIMIQEPRHLTLPLIVLLRIPARVTQVHDPLSILHVWWCADNQSLHWWKDQRLEIDKACCNRSQQLGRDKQEKCEKRKYRFQCFILLKLWFSLICNFWYTPLTCPLITSFIAKLLRTVVHLPSLRKPPSSLPCHQQRFPPSSLPWEGYHFRPTRSLQEDDDQSEDRIGAIIQGATQRPCEHRES